MKTTLDKHIDFLVKRMLSEPGNQPDGGIPVGREGKLNILDGWRPGTKMGLELEYAEPGKRAACVWRIPGLDGRSPRALADMLGEYFKAEVKVGTIFSQTPPHPGSGESPRVYSVIVREGIVSGHAWSMKIHEREFADGTRDVQFGDRSASFAIMFDERRRAVLSIIATLIDANAMLPGVVGAFGLGNHKDPRVCFPLAIQDEALRTAAKEKGLPLQEIGGKDAQAKRHAAFRSIADDDEVPPLSDEPIPLMCGSCYEPIGDCPECGEELVMEPEHVKQAEAKSDFRGYLMPVSHRDGFEERVAFTVNLRRASQSAVSFRATTSRTGVREVLRFLVDAAGS